MEKETVADPKDRIPESDEPQHPGEAPVESESYEEMSFTQEVDALDFTEPTDFAYPAEAVGEAEAVADTEFGESLETDSIFPEAEAVAVDVGEGSVVAGEGIADLGEAAIDEDEAIAAEGVKKPAAWLGLADWVVAVLAIGLLWGLLTLATNFPIWNAVYVVVLGLIPFVLWKTRKRWTTPEITAVYTIMLAIAVAALWTAVYWLGLELARYQWDIKAKKARDMAAQSARPSTTAADGPLAIQVTLMAAAADEGIASPWITGIGQSGSGVS